MKPINFDQLACAPILTEVREVMMPFLSGNIGNPLSLHIFGEGPKKAIENARNNVARLIGS
jgi:cysteine desulfurase